MDSFLLIDSKKLFQNYTKDLEGHIKSTHQEVSYMLRISKEKFQLRLNLDACFVENSSIHMCKNCDNELSSLECDLFVTISIFEISMSKEMMTNIVHITGCIFRNMDTSNEGDTFHYFETNGEYTYH